MTDPIFAKHMVQVNQEGAYLNIYGNIRKYFRRFCLKDSARYTEILKNYDCMV